MSPSDLVSAVESGDLRPLRGLRDSPGLGEAYFLRIAALLGSDPAGAAALGRRWKQVLASADRPDFVWRARAAALRATGRWRSSADAFLAGSSLAETERDRLVFAVGAIDSLARAGDGRRAIALGRRLVRGFDRLGDVAWAARARLNLANALVWQDRYREAIGQYRLAWEAAPTAFERASATLGLSTSLLFHGNPLEAEEFARRASEEFNALGLGTFAAQATVNLAHAAILAGRPEDGWDLLRGLEGELDSEADRGRISEFTADALAALNLHENAIDAYVTAARLARSPLNRANAAMGLARSLDATGKVQLAEAAYSRAIAAYGRAVNPVWQEVARFERSRLRRDARAIRLHAGKLHALRATYWTACANVALAELGDEDALARAARLVERQGYLGLRWRVDWARAKRSGSLSAYRTMAANILQDRMATRSISARMGFFRDKGVAMREYFTALVDLGTDDAYREALQAIQASRSAALIDEIIAQPSFEPLRQEVERFRATLQFDAGEPGGARRAGPVSLRPRVLAIEPVREAAISTNGSASPCVWIDLGDDFAKISGGHGEKVRGSRIREALRWLEFEMTAPMIDRHACANDCERLLLTLAHELGDIGPHVCPDGALWQVPWGAVGSGSTALLMSPSFAAKDVSLPKNPSVLVWFQEREDLPWVTQEVGALREIFPQAVCCASAADARRSLDGAYDLVHIATHARLNRENPMFSHFEFADGPVFAIDIARSTLRTQVAILAGCETGRVQLAFPDEPDGLVRAFLARGAASVVAGLWPLDDEAACVTTVAAASALAEGNSVRDAVGVGRTACRRKFDHPYFWGALSLFGGYEHAPQ